MRPKPGQKENPEEPQTGGSFFELSWQWVATSSRRERCFEGLLLGCAVGEALSLSRNGLSPRRALRLFGRTPLRYQFGAGRGFPGDRTHGLIITIQSMLESRADHRTFGRRLANRLFWYRVGTPIRSLVRFFLARRIAMTAPVMPGQLVSDPLIRGAAISLMIQGNQHANRWIESSTSLSSSQEKAPDVAMLIAHAVQVAQRTDSTGLAINTSDVLESLIKETDAQFLKDQLIQLRAPLAANKSVGKTASSLGWADGVPPRMDAIAILAIYAWLRHFSRFRLAVERAVLVGGECSAVAALTGALCGATLGKRSIPREWLDPLTLFPHDKPWRKDLVARVTDWPHGVEDIQNTNAQPSQIMGQVFRNCVFGCFSFLHFCLRIPARLMPLPPRS